MAGRSREHSLLEVEAFFRAYEVACASMDAEAVCGFYGFPCLIGVTDAQFSYQGAAELRPAMEWVLSGHRKMGVVDSEIRSVEIEVLSDSFAKANLVWFLSDAAGGELASLPCTYVLRRAEGRWKITFAASHAEDQGSADRANASGEAPGGRHRNGG
jgi:ketosteroid isomerase-like protein